MTSGRWESFQHWCESNNSDLINQWDYEKNAPYLPKNIGISSRIKFWWIGRCGHKWDATFGSRLGRGSGCPICANLRVLEGYNDLLTTNPALANEWHSTLNGSLKPTDVIEGSSRKIWWLCSRGHSYKASICDRHRGNGCPYCSGKKPILGETDVASQCPRLAREWHPIKNEGRSPNEFTIGSSRKVWWLCERGHEWQATINSRVKGNNCPYCGNQMLLSGYNDLATTHPEWALQWHPTKNGDLKPNMVFGSSGRKYWWICDNGHEWDSSPNNRTKVPGCPVCSGHRMVTGITDLATIAPELAIEWHPTKNGSLLPNMVHNGSMKKVWWMCNQGHEWQANIDRRRAGNGCPYCSGRMAISGETDLATINPTLALEWHSTKNGVLKPSDVKPCSSTKVWWKCKKGHEWRATVSDRSRMRGCPYCYVGTQTSFNEKAIYVCLCKTFPNLKIEPNYEGFRKDGIYDLDIYLPDLNLAIEYDGPRHDNPKREKSKNDKCSKKGIKLLRIKEHLRNIDEGLFVEPFLWISDHASAKEIDVVIAKLERYIASKAGIADYKSHAHCSMYRSLINEMVIIVPEKSLADVYPEVAKQWHPTKNGSLTPEDVYANSNRFAWWQCEKGHEWEALISSRHRTGCPFCSNRRIIVGENDFATTDPELAKQWHPTKNGSLTPQMIVRGNNKKIWWLGKCGHEWEATVSHRRRGRGSPICANKKIVSGINDLQTRNPELAKQWHPTKNGNLLPSMVASTISKKVWWLGSCGHEWEATIGSRNRGNGCPFCGGFIPIKGKTDLATLRPELAKEWHPTKNGTLTPDQVLPNCHVEIWWVCDRGHEWKKMAHGRGKCPYCSNMLVLSGYNDLQTKFPKIAMQFDLDTNNCLPSKVLCSSKELYWWKCINGHLWQSTIADRVKSRGICIECMCLKKV